MKRCLVVILITAVCTTTGCESEANVTAEDLVGIWEVMSATRDGRHTETLNGAVFVFDPDGTMTTNITGEEDSGSYEMTDGMIVHRAQLAAHYSIDHLEMDTMILYTQIQGRRFGFNVVRKSLE